MSALSEPSATGSRRVSAARSRAGERLVRQRAMLRPLGWAMAAVVAAGALGGTPSPAAGGVGLGVTLAVAAFCALLALAIRDGFARRTDTEQAALIALMGAAGVALAALQPQGSTELASGAAVWMAVARLPLRVGGAIAAAVTGGLAASVAVASRSASVVLAATLLCALLALVARFMRQARESQDRTELLLAELEDAREEQTRTAAIAERGRIAGELHDVLAHSLSGAAIQLQGARLLAEREGAGAHLRATLDRAGELVKDGLSSARQAVGALRGEPLPGVGQLQSLVDRVGQDLELPLTLRVEGPARAVPVEASLALYRATQEALTNIARHAPGATATVRLQYLEGTTALTVENGAAPVPEDTSGDDAELRHAGGGRGLAGLRERLERVGGSVTSGPTDAGWRVHVEVPV